MDISSVGSTMGTGGMVTKLIAAELAAPAGVRTIITHAQEPNRVQIILDQLSQGIIPEFGTHFLPKMRPLNTKRWWTSAGFDISGIIYVDKGAKEALSGSQKSSLFAAGITKVQGNFNAQQSVSIIFIDKDEQGKDVEVEIARGLVSYSAKEIEAIMGHNSSEFTSILGYCDTEHVIHRNTITLID